MAAKGDSEGFVSSPLDRQGAHHKDLYYPMSDENAAELRDTDAEFRGLKADFLRIARNCLQTTGRFVTEWFIKKPFAGQTSDSMMFSQSAKIQDSNLLLNRCGGKSNFF